VKQSAPESTGGIKTNRGAHVEETEALQQTESEPAEEMDQIIEEIQESLDSEDMPLSVADLMRLLEMRHELAESELGPLTMGWIGEWPPAEE
jgi:hypothetical protein